MTQTTIVIDVDSESLKIAEGRILELVKLVLRLEELIERNRILSLIFLNKKDSIRDQSDIIKQANEVLYGKEI